jgi:transposase
MRQRLFPTFQKVYPGKKMYLVLDNAKYHHHRGPDWFAPSKKTRGQLADFLRQRAVKSITVDGQTFPASKFSADARGKNGGPTLKQLQEAVKEHLKQHPEINSTVPQQLMEDQDYELLYTPPYVSELQPIELIWAYTKHLVARQSHRKRTVSEAATQTRVAMDQVDALLCRKEIAHVHKWIMRFMQSAEGGSLRRFFDLPMLMDARSEWIQADDLPPDISSDDDNDEEDKENRMEWTQ